jgi:hypothetical protein
MRASSLVLLLLAQACDRPDNGLVICHNANCAEPADPDRDDTIEAMQESLALLDGDTPIIDGIEVDTFWRGSDDVCLYAHDLDNDQTPALEPATELAAYFARSGPISHGDAPFHVFLELKSHVSPDKSDLHSPAQLDLHAACAWQLYDTLAAAAVANDRDVVVFFSAFNPDLLRAVIAQQPAVTPLPVKLGAIQGVPAPLDNQTRSLDEYRGIPLDLVEFHAQWILDAQYEAVRSLDIDLGVFMFSATVETFAVIEQYEPTMIVTSEARLIRRWLDR